MITLHDYLEAEMEVDVNEQKLGWRIHAWPNSTHRDLTAPR